MHPHDYTCIFSLSSLDYISHVVPYLLWNFISPLNPGDTIHQPVIHITHGVNSPYLRLLYNI